MPVITVQCPHCARSYSVDASVLGRKGRCKGCGQSFALTLMDEDARPPSASGVPSTLTAEPSPTALAQAFPLPETIGRFAVKERLGTGAFGTVYRATDPVLNREVALKVPHAGLLGNTRAAERFLREARAAAALRHPHIVTLFETGVDQSEHYIATEFIEGTTLAAAVGQDGLDPRRAAEIVAALAEALQYAHAQGIIHRDVKPANVMLDQEGQPHLMDFGLARIEGAGGERLTQAGAVVGTPAYLAPEQAAGGTEANGASDQYSLGATLFELLTGRTPFVGAPEVVIYNLTHGGAPLPRSVKPGIPRDLETICLRAMAKEPAGRYASCRELADDLNRWLRGEPILARRPGALAAVRRWAGRHRVAAGLAAGLLAGFLALAAGMVASRRGSADPRPTAPGNLAKSERPPEPNVVTEADRGASEPGPKPPGPGEAKSSPPPAGPKPADPGAGAVVEKAPERSKTTAPAATAKAQPPPDPDAKLTYAERIQAAYRASRQGDPARAEKLLAGCPDESRGWEWYHCKRLCRFPSAALEGHSGPVHCVAFSPDGKWLASGGEDAKVRVWEGWGPAARLLDGHSKPVVRVEFSGDGNRLISVGRDRTSIEVFEWDLVSGRPTVLLKRSGELTTVDISADGRWIAGGTGQGTIKVWKAEKDAREYPTGKAVRARPIREVAFLPDGQELLYRTSDGWSLLHRGPAKEAVGKRNHKAVTRKGDKIGCLAQSPDGRRLATASGNVVTTYDRSTLQKTGEFQDDSGVVTALAFSREGKLLAMGSGDTIEVWDTTSREWRTTFQGPDGAVSSIRFSPDGLRIAASCLDGKIYLWGLSDGLSEKAVDLAFSRTDPLVRERWMRSEDGFPRICFPDEGARVILYQPFSVNAGPPFRTYTRNGWGSPLEGGWARVYWLDRRDFTIARTVTPVSSLSGHSGLAALCDSGRILVRDLTDGSDLFETDLGGYLEERSGGANKPLIVTGSVRPREILILDRTRIYVNFEKPEIVVRGVWDQRIGGWVWKHELITRVDPGDGNSAKMRHFYDSCLIQNSRYLVMIHRSGPGAVIEVLSALTGDVQREFPGDSYRIHAGGDSIAIVRKGGISVHGMRDGHVFGTFAGADCSFSPSGKLLATWAKSEAAVWDLATGRERFRIKPASPVAFSPDDRSILAARKDALVVKDALTGTDLLELPGPMNRFAFSPDGSSIISANFDRAKIWVADPPEAGSRAK